MEIYLSKIYGLNLHNYNYRVPRLNNLLLMVNQLKLKPVLFSGSKYWLGTIV